MTTLTIAVALLHDHPVNESLYGPVVADQEMTQSIRERGVLQRLRVTPLGEEDVGAFRIISGHRRKVNAVAAGLEEVPCEVVYYDNAQDEIIDLVHSNKARQKTEAQKTAEVSRLRSALGEAAKALKNANLSSKDSPMGDKSPRTSEVIAEKLGVSKDEVKYRTMLADTDYREKFYEKLRGMGADEQIIEECATRWASIKRQQDIGELAITPAAKEVKALQKEMLSRCAPEKKRKGAKAKAASKGRKPKAEPKPAVDWIPPDDTPIVSIVDENELDLESFTGFYSFVENMEEYVVGTVVGGSYLVVQCNDRYAIIDDRALGDACYDVFR